MRDVILAQSQQLLPQMVDVRRRLHTYAETGWLEFYAGATAAKRLRELGYNLTMGERAVSAEHRMGVPAQEVINLARQRALDAGADPDLVAAMGEGFTGLWGDLECGGGDGPCFALRFDMDANDIWEATDQRHKPASEGYGSVHEGAMHACGHDSHVAMGLAVAEILAKLAPKLRGRIRIIFQPGEEGSRGAGPMVAAGCLDGVDYALGMHIGAQADRKGRIICGSRKFLATDKWDVHFTGKAAHAGMSPHEGKNAILAACTATLNMHAIARHGDGATRITVGKIQGGQGRNVIPPDAGLVMETRGATTELNEYMAREARRILEAAAAMWDCSVAITAVGAAPSGESSPEMVDAAMRIANSLPDFDVVEGILDFSGTEDFAHMMTSLQKQGGQATYLQIGTTLAAGHHNEFFDIDEQDMVSGVRMGCLMVAEYLARGCP